MEWQKYPILRLVMPIIIGMTVAFFLYESLGYQPFIILPLLTGLAAGTVYAHIRNHKRAFVILSSLTFLTFGYELTSRSIHNAHEEYGEGWTYELYKHNPFAIDKAHEVQKRLHDTYIEHNVTGEAGSVVEAMTIGWKKRIDKGDEGCIFQGRIKSHPRALRIPHHHRVSAPSLRLPRKDCNPSLAYNMQHPYGRKPLGIRLHGRNATFARQDNSHVFDIRLHTLIRTEGHGTQLMPAHRIDNGHHRATHPLSRRLPVVILCRNRNMRLGRHALQTYKHKIAKGEDTGSAHQATWSKDIQRDEGHSHHLTRMQHLHNPDCCLHVPSDSVALHHLQPCSHAPRVIPYRHISSMVVDDMEHGLVRNRASRPHVDSLNRLRYCPHHSIHTVLSLLL